MRVGLISRRWKRFLLNERELGYALLDAGYDVRLLALEDMTLYEQVAALRATTLLVGVHGSGLNNALYLRPGAAVLQIVPFGLRYRGDFEGIATRNGVGYGELVLEDMSVCRRWVGRRLWHPRASRRGKETPVAIDSTPTSLKK